LHILFCVGFLDDFLVPLTLTCSVSTISSPMETSFTRTLRH